VNPRDSGIDIYPFLINIYGSRYGGVPAVHSQKCVYSTGGIGSKMTQNPILPWVFPRLVTSASVWRIPRRSCESSQRADRVGSDRDVKVDVKQTSLFSCKNRRCVNVRVFFREKKHRIYRDRADLAVHSGFP